MPVDRSSVCEWMSVYLCVHMSKLACFEISLDSCVCVCVSIEQQENDKMKQSAKENYANAVRRKTSYAIKCGMLELKHKSLAYTHTHTNMDHSQPPVDLVYFSFCLR